MKSILGILLVIGLIMAAWLVMKGLGAPQEPSALTMHPSNFEKPPVEQISSPPSDPYDSTVFMEHYLNGTEGYVTSSGVEIFYRSFGSGEPLLIINGGPGMSSEGFIPLAQNLAKNRRTILFDQRGTGHSIIKEPSAQNISIDLMVQDMEALRNHFNIDRWTILGHSFGGMMAAYYASKHPDTIEGLILSSSGGLDLQLLSYINITGNLTKDQQDSLQFWNQQIAEGDTSYHAAYHRGLALAPAYLYDKKFVPIIAERLTQGNMIVNGLVFDNMRHIAFNCKPGLQNFGAPTLIIQGAQDIIDVKTAERTKEILSHARVVILDECGHYGWLDQKESYFSEINEFLSSL